MSVSLSASQSDLHSSATHRTRRRYAIVGCGARSQLYQDAIETIYNHHAELVAVCDRNPGRVELARERARRNGAVVPAGYPAGDFSRMVRETRPDAVIVLTIDAYHHEYLIRTMETGCDAITEKPLTTTPEHCQEILDTRRRTGRNCRVTHNYRYSPPRTQVKELLMDGVIGDVLSVDFHWVLNTIHGADYFRRWHSDKRNSGGLIVHKATHHFDLVNWWLSAVPVSVFASGVREYYRPETALRMGLSSPHERCHTCPELERCSFALDIAGHPGLRPLYFDQERYDGYFRDRCVWRSDISIEDAISVFVQYDTGATLTYSLNAFNAWEGYTIAFSGTKGRLEHSMAEQVYLSGTDAIQGAAEEDGVSTRIIPMRGTPYSVPIWRPDGSHGGGDRPLLDDLFAPSAAPDKYLRAADERAGAYSALVGMAANRCFETHRPVLIADLVHGLEPPAYPAMPSRSEPLPMPGREALQD
ncbi:gfo/Idh/MocA family oxidoreductase [Opitutaceae bacterium EW11]|nr:gfo/Idh/MocA family oxidoreductase [Opitutaceae bacterium EW11]